MSILEQQNIIGANFNEEDPANPTDRRMRAALGGSYSPSEPGWGGFSYHPRHLTSLIGAMKGQIGGESPTMNYGMQRINDGAEETRYGPDEYASLSNSSLTVLGAFADMIGNNGSVWSTGDVGQAMKTTFTSGEQMRSLWNSEVGVNGTPVASGGQFSGYQDNHRYGISNWNASETHVTEQVMQNREATQEEKQKAFTDEGREAMQALDQSGVDEEVTAIGKLETTYPMVDITATGIRAIPGMMGPRSDSGNGQENRGS